MTLKNINLPISINNFDNWVDSENNITNIYSSISCLNSIICAPQLTSGFFLRKNNGLFFVRKSGNGFFIRKAGTTNVFSTPPILTQDDKLLLLENGNVLLIENNETPLLLDLYSNATAAYSLRRLRLGYTGPVVKVRRSFGNDEADFTATEVANGTLAAWVGAGNNGFVTTWYDQSGNARHGQQPTSANQPKVVNSGSLVVNDRGKPGILCDGAAYGFIVTRTNMWQGNYYIATVTEPTTSNIAGNHQIIGSRSGQSGVSMRFDGSVNNRLLFFSGANSQVGSLGAGLAIGANPSMIYSVLHINGSPGQAFLYRDGTQRGSSASMSDSSAVTQTAFALLSFGPAGGAGSRFDGIASEIIIWLSDLSSSRLAIDTAIGKHYGIL